MNIRYKVSEQDYLTHLLYNASASPLVLKARNKKIWTVPIIYFVLAGLFYLLNNTGASVALIAFAALWLIFYPYLLKRIYEKNYTKHIRSKFADIVDEEISLTITDDNLLMNDGKNDARIATTEIKEITQLPDILLLHLKAASAIIIPFGKIQNGENVLGRFRNLSQILQVPYNDRSNWKW